jgi:sulfoxide reductase heme-binding subunit YedZ
LVVKDQQFTTNYQLPTINYQLPLKDPQFAKLVVFINSLLPGVLLGWDAYQRQIGPNPIEYALDTTGLTALVFIMLTLSVTPLRKLTGWNFLSHFRRMLGLFAFFYGSVHFLIYFGFDKSFSIHDVIAESIYKPFIMFGMAALLMMIPLAATSTNGIIKSMGAARWKKLHRLVYYIAIAGVLHFYLKVKADHRVPLMYAGVLAVLLGYRGITDAMKRKTLPAG